MPFLNKLNVVSGLSHEQLALTLTGYDCGDAGLKDKEQFACTEVLPNTPNVLEKFVMLAKTIFAEGFEPYWSALKNPVFIHSAPLCFQIRRIK